MVYDQDLVIKADPDTVRQRIEDFMAKNKYVRHKEGLLKVMEFERGAVGANWLAVSPRLWRTIAKIYVYAADDGKSKVTVQWNIATVGQLVAIWEIEYWRSELGELEKALSTGAFEIDPVEKMAYRSFVRSAILFVIGGLISALAGIGIGLLTKNPKWGVAAFLVAFLLTILPFRAWQGFKSVPAAGFKRN